MATPAVSGLSGTGYNALSIPNLTSQQQSLMQLVGKGIRPGLKGGLGQLSSLASGGSPEFWQQLEAPAYRQFGEAAGALGARFSGLGSGAQRSSAFQQAQGGLASELAESLQSQRLALQNQAIQQLSGLYGNLMGTNAFSTGLVPEKQPLWKELLLGGTSGLSQGIGGLGSLWGIGKLGLLR